MFYVFNSRKQLVSVTSDEANASLSCSLRGDGWYYITQEYVDRGGCNDREKEQIKNWKENQE